MSVVAKALDRYVEMRSRAFAWREGLPWVAKAGLAVGFACLTGLMAQLRIPLPHTPVPVTGQVFAVLMCGALLGGAWGGASQTFYVALGAAGVTWFTGMNGGLCVLRGYTGGFLLGFVAAAFLIGWATQRWPSMRRPLPLCALMLGAVGVIYLLGAVQFQAVAHTDLKDTIAKAVAPFIMWDVAKALLASVLAAALLPKE